MVGLSGHLRKVAGASFRTIVRQRSLSGVNTVWGDEFADHAVATAWYPSDWDSVCDDELVLLLPALTAPPSTLGRPGERGPATFVRAAFEKCIPVVHSALAAHLSAKHAETVLRSLLCAHSPALSAARLDNSWFGQDRQAWTTDRLVAELATLVCLDRTLQDAMHGSMRRGEEGQYRPATLAHALEASVHTRVNGAYVYTSYDCMHELLGTAAWLGHVIGGRPALMPTFVADCLIDYGERPLGLAGQADICGRMLSRYGELAIGMPRLMAIAHRVRATGRAVLVQPAGGSRAVDARPVVWDEELFWEIERAVQQAL